MYSIPFNGTQTPNLASSFEPSPNSNPRNMISSDHTLPSGKNSSGGTNNSSSATQNNGSNSRAVTPAADKDYETTEIQTIFQLKNLSVSSQPPAVRAPLPEQHQHQAFSLFGANSDSLGLTLGGNPRLPQVVPQSLSQPSPQPQISSVSSLRRPLPSPRSISLDTPLSQRAVVDNCSNVNNGGSPGATLLVGPPSSLDSNSYNANSLSHYWQSPRIQPSSSTSSLNVCYTPPAPDTLADTSQDLDDLDMSDVDDEAETSTDKITRISNHITLQDSQDSASSIDTMYQSGSKTLDRERLDTFGTGSQSSSFSESSTTEYTMKIYDLLDRPRSFSSSVSPASPIASFASSASPFSSTNNVRGSINNKPALKSNSVTYSSSPSPSPSPSSSTSNLHSSSSSSHTAHGSHSQPPSYIQHHHHAPSPHLPSPASYRTNLLKDRFVYYGPKSEKYKASAHLRRQEQIMDYYKRSAFSSSSNANKISKKNPNASSRMRSSSSSGGNSTSNSINIVERSANSSGSVVVGSTASNGRTLSVFNPGPTPPFTSSSPIAISTTAAAAISATKSTSPLSISPASFSSSSSIKKKPRRTVRFNV